MPKKIAMSTKCSACNERIQDGETYYHHNRVTRFCRPCLQDMIDQVDGKLVKLSTGVMPDKVQGGLYVMYPNLDRPTDTWVKLNQQRFKSIDEVVDAIANALGISKTSIDVSSTYKNGFVVNIEYRG